MEGSKADVDKLLEECLPTKQVEQISQLGHFSYVLEKRRQKWKSAVRKRRRNILTCKDQRDLKVFDIQDGKHKFVDFIPLYQLWLDYMRDLIDTSRCMKSRLEWNQQLMAWMKCCSVRNDGLVLPEKAKSKMTQESLLKADYHGCMMVVKAAICPSLIGQAGIVLMETRNTFKIITKEDKIKCIPKRNTVFAFEFEGHLITLYGNHFCVRTAERVRKKFKTKSTIDIGKKIKQR